MITALADQIGIRARTRGQAQRIEKNGFPRAGFPGQYAKPVPELQIQTFDQNNIADGKGSQHDLFDVIRTERSEV